MTTITNENFETDFRAAIQNEKGAMKQRQLYYAHAHSEAKKGNYNQAKLVLNVLLEEGCTTAADTAQKYFRAHGTYNIRLDEKANQYSVKKAKKGNEWRPMEVPYYNSAWKNDGKKEKKGKGHTPEQLFAAYSTLSDDDKVKLLQMQIVADPQMVARAMQEAA